MGLHSGPVPAIVRGIVRKVASLGRLVVLAVALAGCGGNVAPSQPAASVATPAPTPLPSTTPQASEAPTPTPVTAANCPDPKSVSVKDLKEDEPDCFTGDLVVVAWLDRSPNIGLDPTPKTPLWLTSPADIAAAIWSAKPQTVGDDRQCPAASPDCAWTFFHVAPGSGVTVDTTPRWVRLTGHLHDPAAATCNYDWANIPADFPFQPGSSSPDSVIAECDLAFVVTKIEDTTAP